MAIQVLNDMNFNYSELVRAKLQAIEPHYVLLEGAPAGTIFQGNDRNIWQIAGDGLAVGISNAIIRCPIETTSYGNGPIDIRHEPVERYIMTSENDYNGGYVMNCALDEKVHSIVRENLFIRFTIRDYGGFGYGANKFRFRLYRDLMDESLNTINSTLLDETVIFDFNPYKENNEFWNYSGTIGKLNGDIITDLPWNYTSKIRVEVEGIPTQNGSVNYTGYYECQELRQWREG